MMYKELFSSNIPLITKILIDDSLNKFSYLKENKNKIKYATNNDDLVDLSFLLSRI